MKKDYLLKLMMIFLMVSVSVSAQVFTDDYFYGQKPLTAIDSIGFNVSQKGKCKVFLPKAERVMRTAEAGDVTLTIRLEYGPEFDVSRLQVTVQNEDARFFFNYMGEDVIEASVPKGTYDILTCFQKYWGAPCYVIKENMSIDGDMSVTLNPDMATNRISVKNYSPSGELFKHGLAFWDETTGNVGTLEKGNVLHTEVIHSIICKGLGEVLGVSCGFSGDQFSEEDRVINYDIHVNDVSDRYLFAQTRIVFDEDYNWYISYFSTDNVKNGVLENDPEKYIQTEDTWQFSKYGKDKVGYELGIMFSHLYDGIRQRTNNLRGSFNEEKKDAFCTNHTYVNMPFEDPYDQRLNMMVCSSFCDYAVEVQNGPYVSVVFPSRVMGTHFFIKDGERINVNLGSVDSYLQNNGLHYVPRVSYGREIESPLLLPSHPAYTYSSSKQKGVLGSTCPINEVIVANFYSPWMERKTTRTSFSYLGRYGETRWCDDSLTVVRIAYNGEHIKNPSEWMPEEEGVFDITYVNSNVEVDGLQGRNETCVHYDMRQEDSTPPTLTMLQFKNNNDEIIDRFDSSSDGTMEFSAGDFDYHFTDWQGYFNCKTLNVVVEYAPYNTEQWTPMEIEEDVELYREVGWGYFYRASLKDVEGEAEKGWFDVRFTMSDETGNTHVQTVSPAFRIDDCVATGVETVNVGSMAVAGRYGLDGKRVEAPQKGINIVRLQNGEVRKAVVR